MPTQVSPNLQMMQPAKLIDVSTWQWPHQQCLTHQGWVPPLPSRLICHRWVPSGGAVCSLIPPITEPEWVVSNMEERQQTASNCMSGHCGLALGQHCPLPKGLRMVKCCHKLVFHARCCCSVLYLCVCVRKCVCGRCAITVSSFNPRISSKWDASGKHWSLL